MYRIKIALVLMLASISCQLMANKFSVNTSVKFVDPEKFTDFKTKANLASHDRKKLMSQLEILIKQSAEEYIRSGNDLQIVIHNVDMAGSFLYAGSDYVRVIYDSDRTRLMFSYQLKDSRGKVLKQDTVNLTSRNPKLLKRNINKYRHSSFKYEMLMFDDWISEVDSV